MKINVAHILSCRIKTDFLNALIAFMLFSFLPACLQAAEKEADRFSGLRQKLVGEGFDEKKLDHYYGHPKIVFEAEAVGRYFQHRESSLNYDQFLTQDSLGKARQYMENHRYWLERAEAEYQVKKEIITAILLVETRLGTYVGKASALNILSSMAALSDPSVREDLWQALSGKTKLTRDEYRKKADRKSQWAYVELVAFLKYVDQEGIATPVRVPGSYAGAIGISQFMPSNILTLGIDGDKDGRLNLFTHVDAIFSVANYLRHHGWKPGISPEETRKVLFAYNHSTYYVDILMRLSRALEKK